MELRFLRIMWLMTSCCFFTALALCFCWPSREKFENETGLELNHDGVKTENQRKA